MTPELTEQPIRIGYVSGLQGVNGWVKIFSDTQPRENIFSYQPWLLSLNERYKSVKVLQWRRQGKTLVAKLEGVESRDQAHEIMGSVIVIDTGSMPNLGPGNFYWHQLIGLRVFTDFQGHISELGFVTRLLETGANDVLVVVSDDKEHLVPWVPDEFVKQVDLDAGTMTVDWDPNF